MLITPRPLRRHAALLTGLTAAAFVGILVLSFGNAVLRAQIEFDAVTGTGTGVIAEEQPAAVHSSSSNTVSSASSLPKPVTKAGNVVLTVRPHCEKNEQNHCPLFTVTTPLNLETTSLSVGDTLDIDILEQNIRKLPVSKIRAWLTYDPTVLEGTAIIPSAVYSVATPGEQEFDVENGYAKVEVQPGNDANTTPLAPVAQVTFTVKSAPAGGQTVIGFYDADGEEPHTAVYDASETPVNVLSKSLGSLLVRIHEERAAPAAEEEPTEPKAIESQPDEFPTPLSKPLEDTPPADTVAEPPDPPAEPEQPVAELPPMPEHFAAEESSVSSDDALEPLAETSSTTFALLQVQNVRVTSVQGSLYVAWDLLAAPGLQGYYVYYGTDTGRYIQRRGVASTERSTAIHELPDGTPYFVAVRGVQGNGEETAFSKEASVTIGDARTSTSPLLQRDVPVGKNPIQNGQSAQVPGESGIPSAAILLLILSAVIGTLLAFRRQAASFALLPHE